MVKYFFYLCTKYTQLWENVCLRNGQMQMFVYVIERSQAEEQKLYADTPLWSKVAFGIAVFAGAIASIMLLMKKKLSSMIFTISLLAVLAQQFYIFFVSNTMQVLGYGQAVMPAIVIIIAVALVHFANSCRKKRWIN